jgi:5-formyltetrahydrofolate cyclo-ligase
MQESKPRIRKRLLAERASLDETAIRAAGLAVAKRSEQLPAIRSAHEMLAYWPVRGEVDARPIIEAMWSRSARVLFPRCRPDEPGLMDVACASCFEELTPGSYGIPEPDPERCEALDHLAPDVVLVPAVAYDRRGYRIGYGGGYYDRLLDNGALNGAMLIGLAYDFQVLDAVPADDWDHPVHLILTPSETIEARP